MIKTFKALIQTHMARCRITFANNLKGLTLFDIENAYIEALFSTKLVLHPVCKSIVIIEININPKFLSLPKWVYTPLVYQNSVKDKTNPGNLQ